MYIVSDEVNSFGGRFPSDELGHLAELLVDSPVMVGHRKDKLPVARTFHAEIVTRDDKNWVKSYFYWLRSSSGADDLMQNIDAGIYKECSIGFTYMFPECSVCSKDIRTCRHEPFEQYQVGGDRHTCHFNYRQVERVLETSLVYRGAVPDTAMSKELVADNKAVAVSETRISSPAELPLGATYLVVPYYESVPVIVTVEGGAVDLEDFDGNPVNSNIIKSLGRQSLPDMDRCWGQLVGYRGKERCSIEQLKKHLSGKSSSVTRVELKLIPGNEVNLEELEARDKNRPVSVIRHEFCTLATLHNISSKLATKHGVRLWAIDRLPPDHGGYLYRPEKKSESQEGYYRFCLPSGRHDAVLELCLGDTVESYRLKQFHITRFIKGCRFVADKVEDTASPGESGFNRIICGEVKLADASDEALALNVNGTLSGRLFVQSIELNGIDRFLVYHRPDTAETARE